MCSSGKSQNQELGQMEMLLPTLSKGPGRGQAPMRQPGLPGPDLPPLLPLASMGKEA